MSNLVRGGSRAAATFKMERFVIIVNDWKPLTIITKRSILYVAAALDLPLIVYSTFPHRNQTCNIVIYIFNVRITIRMLLTIIKRLEIDIDINIEMR